MTTVEEQAVEPVPVEERATPAPRPSKTTRRLEARRRVGSVALGGLAVVVIAALVFSAFEGPLAQSWYSVRQHQLASRFSSFTVHKGSGAPIALLQIPVLGTNLVVAEGDSPRQLRSGPGHRIGSPMPGEKGNSVIVGHRNGWGGALHALGALKPGALIVVQTNPNGLPRDVVFKVDSTRRVSGSDPAPFAESTDHRLTIVTGSGGAYSDARLVVTAVSGPVGRVLPPTAGVRATTSSGSRVWNAEMLFALVGIGGAVALAFLLRRRYHPVAVAAIVVPVALLGVVSLLLNVDAALPPFR
jgi:LPXTG-site transpeptidase (sortase) family protein